MSLWVIITWCKLEFGGEKIEFTEAVGGVDNELTAHLPNGYWWMNFLTASNKSRLNINVWMCKQL